MIRRSCSPAALSRSFRENSPSPPIANGQTSQVDATVQEAAHEFADFLLGLTLQHVGAIRNVRRKPVSAHSWDVAGYAQDDWRVNKKFTVLAGVRYEIHTPPIELYNHMANLDLAPNLSAVVAVVTPMTTPVPLTAGFSRAD